MVVLKHTYDISSNLTEEHRWCIIYFSTKGKVKKLKETYSCTYDYISATNSSSCHWKFPEFMYILHTF